MHLLPMDDLSLAVSRLYRAYVRPMPTPTALVLQANHATMQHYHVRPHDGARLLCFLHMPMSRLDYAPPHSNKQTTFRTLRQDL